MNMRKRYAVGALICCAIAAGGLLWMGRQTPLGKTCPAIAGGTYHAELRWEGEGVGEAALSDGEFRDILGAAQVKRGKKITMEPSPCFDIRLQDGQTTYSILVGEDVVTVARLDDLEGTRRFWTDGKGEIFAQLYARHLDNGGEALPTPEAKG